MVGSLGYIGVCYYYYPIHGLYIRTCCKKRGRENCSYSTAKRVIDESEADIVADFEDHNSGEVSASKKFAENNPNKSNFPYHQLTTDEITKRKDKSFIKFFFRRHSSYL